MSIINRTLADLENRGASRPRGGGHEMISERPRRRTLPPRALSLVLAVVLVVIAIALWSVRGERVLAVWQSFVATAGTGTAPAVPDVVGLAFEGGADNPRLTLRLTEPVGRAPRYRRSGSGASLALAARALDVMVPAPPAQQSVFRGIAVDSEGAGHTRVRLEVAAEAELDLRVDGRRIVLSGHLPPSGSSAPVPEASAAADGPGAERVEPSSRPGSASAEAAAAGDTAPAGGAGAAHDDRAATASAPVEADRGEAGTETAAETQVGAGGGDPGDSVARVATAATEPQASVEPEPEPKTEPKAEPETEPKTEPKAESETEPKAEPETEPAATANAGADGANSAEPTQRAQTESADAGSAPQPTVRKTQSLPPESRARRRYREARQALAGGEVGTARRLLTQAIELDPTLHPARDLLIGLWRRVGDAAAARRLLEEGIALAPERVQYAMPYARLLVDTGELERAANVLARARTAANGNAGFHALAAAVAQRRGRHEQAAREYTHALEADAGNGLWWLGLGISLAATDRTEEARTALREARASGDLSENLDRWAEGRIAELGDGSEG